MTRKAPKMAMPKGITKRGDSYRVSVMLNGQRETATCDTLIEAMQEAQRIRSGITREEATPVDPWTMGHASMVLLRDKIAPILTRATFNTKSSYHRKVLAHFGEDKLIGSLKAAEVDAFVRFLRVESSFSVSYSNGLLATLRHMQELAIERGGMVGPVLKLDKMKGRQGRVRFITPVEETEMIKWCDHAAHDDLKDLIVLAFDTGMRMSEMMALEFAGVDLEHRRLDVWVSKTGTRRSVGVTARVEAMIRKRLRRAGAMEPTSKVFNGGGAETFRRQWRTMRASMGLEHDEQFVIHTMRHTCCTRLIAAGIDIRTVMQWMGHQSIITTMGYAHFIPHMTNNATAALEAV